MHIIFVIWLMNKFRCFSFFFVFFWILNETFHLKGCICYIIHKNTRVYIIHGLLLPITFRLTFTSFIDSSIVRNLFMSQLSQANKSTTARWIASDLLTFLKCNKVSALFSHISVISVTPVISMPINLIQLFNEHRFF